jgi:hypothetical protein
MQQTSRTRTQGTISTDELTYTTKTFSGSEVVTKPAVGSILDRGRSQTTTDVVTANYKALVSRGRVINNPFRSITVDVGHSWPGHQIQTNSGSGSTIKLRTWSHYYNDIYGFPGSPWGHAEGLGDALRDACTEAAARVDRSDVDGLVEAGEARETMDLFNRQSWSLRRQVEKELKYARKRGWKFPVNVPIAVMSNNWLRYRYGIAPLLGLLNDTLVTGTRVRARRQTARGSASVHSTWEEQYPGGGYYHPSSMWTVRGSITTSVRAGILYEYERWSNKYGFTPDKIPEAAWNLAPWTFVADWVWNTGEFISALTPRMNVARLATWHGYESIINRVLTVEVGPVKSGFTVTQDCSGGYSSHTHTARIRRPGLLAPHWHAKEGALREIITSEKIVDAFALTSQLLFQLMRATPGPKSTRRSRRGYDWRHEPVRRTS